MTQFTPTTADDASHGPAAGEAEGAGDAATRGPCSRVTPSAQPVELDLVAPDPRAMACPVCLQPAGAPCVTTGTPSDWPIGTICTARFWAALKAEREGGDDGQPDTAERGDAPGPGGLRE